MQVKREELNKKKQQEIVHTEVVQKTKKHLVRFIKIFSILTVLISSFFLYLRYLGTSGLEIREYRVVNSSLPQSFHGFKIVHFTDLHYGSTIFQQELKHLVEEMNLLNPDIVVFSGDLIDKNFHFNDDDLKVLSSELVKISARVGKYAVTGNHDYQDDSFLKVMNQSGFMILDNSSQLIYYKGYIPILLVGLSDTIQGKTEIDKAFSYFKEEGSQQDIFTIGLFHEPDLLDDILATYSLDIAMAGHSHNGQVRLPFLGPLITINGARQYDDEYYRVGKTDLYISGGLGTSNYKFRYFTRPSFNFYRLVEKD